MKKFFLALYFLSFISLPAAASDFQGYVVGVFVIWGKVYVGVNNGAFNGKGSPCTSATNYGYYMIDASTTFGKLMYSNALMAKTTGRLVYISGDNNCNPNPYGPDGAEGMAGIDLKG